MLLDFSTQAWRELFLAVAAGIEGVIAAFELSKKEGLAGSLPHRQVGVKPDSDRV
jgi:hypothetical protein